MNAKQVVLITTTKATAPIIANRFVGFDGKQAKAAQPVFGVAPRDADNGDTFGVEVMGIVNVESGGAITAGAKVASDAQGCAVVGTNNVAGVAVSAATAAGELVSVLLLKG